MNQASLRFNPRYLVSCEEIQRKLLLSMEAAEAVGSREMRCPICGFKVTDVPLTQTEVVFVKYRKCKFEDHLVLHIFAG